MGMLAVYLFLLACLICASNAWVGKAKGGSSHIYYHDRPKIHKPDETIPSGLCCLFKPKGWSMTEAAKRVKYILQNELKFIYEFKNPKIKVSHFERKLDRQAQGVMLVAVGAAYPLIFPKYINGDSVYVIDGWFGTETEEKDDEGKVTKFMDYDSVTRRDILRILPQFRGIIKHKPPFEYLGAKMSQATVDYLFGGVWPEHEPITVNISQLTMSRESATQSLPYFDLQMRCDWNTYPRVVIDDMAKRLKSSASISNLIRIRQSGFHYNEALNIEACSYEEVKKNILRTSKKVGIDCSALAPAEKYWPTVVKGATIQERNRLRKEERQWLASKGGEQARVGSGLDEASSEPSFFEQLGVFAAPKGGGGDVVTLEDDADGQATAGDTTESAASDEEVFTDEREDASTMEITDEL